MLWEFLLFGRLLSSFPCPTSSGLKLCPTEGLNVGLAIEVQEWHYHYIEHDSQSRIVDHIFGPLAITCYLLTAGFD